MRISAFNRSCERKQSHIYPSRSLKKVAISFDHDPILFSTANPADEVFGRHRRLEQLLRPRPRANPLKRPGADASFIPPTLLSLQAQPYFPLGNDEIEA